MKFQQTDGGCTQQSERKSDLDCTVRALAIAGRLDYDTAWSIMARSGRLPNGTGNMLSGLVEAHTQGHIRFEHIEPNYLRFDRWTLAQFAKQNPRGRYIVRIKGGRGFNHVLALVDGVVCDKQSQHGRHQVKAAWRIL